MICTGTTGSREAVSLVKHRLKLVRGLVLAWRCAVQASNATADFTVATTGLLTFPSWVVLTTMVITTVLRVVAVCAVLSESRYYIRASTISSVGVVACGPSSKQWPSWRGGGQIKCLFMERKAYWHWSSAQLQRTARLPQSTYACPCLPQHTLVPPKIRHPALCLPMQI